MANEAEISRLRAKAKTLLTSSVCKQIRFKLDNVAIQYLMYGYVAGLIAEDHVHIKVESGDGYDHVFNTMTFSSADPHAATIVHEATHAVIDATNAGKDVTKGTHETAAYLAETIFSLLSGDSPDLGVPYLTPPLVELAGKVMAFNKSGKSGLFVCPLTDTEYVKKILASSRLAGAVDRVDRMDGVPYQSGGLLWRMRQEAR